MQSPSCRTTFSFGNHSTDGPANPTCLVAEVSRDVVVVAALVLARLEQVERFVVPLLDVVAAAVLRVVTPAAAAVALLVGAVVLVEDVAVDARRSRRVLQCRVISA